MAFFKGLLRNLAIFLGAGLIIYVLEPEMVRGAFEAYWMVLGPIGVLLTIVAVIPKRRNDKR